MESAALKTLTMAVVRILRPLVRILLRNGVSFRTFSDIAKGVYVDTAANEFGLDNRKQTISRISVITGLSRKEVKRVKEKSRPSDAEIAERYNRAARVIAAWRREPRYTDRSGTPLVLPLTGDGPSFAELVRQFSGDLPYRAILDELVNTDAVEITDMHRVKLLRPAYVSATDDPVNLHILGTDAGLLIETIDHNMQADESRRVFQRKVSYDNLPEAALPVFEVMAAESAQHLLEKLDGWLARNDRDSNPEVQGVGRHCAGLGIYYFQRPHSDKDG
ncbi:hypothetical protein DSCA_58960 [Desulfosarcina alkanivorans]|uniref:Uncharacterized protein n=2 Tax=Desulfosarcina alkanivorans TaxID=571177 RepID=A0A5K7YRR7_9BACT|nr:hypothetical protein DSCA_58960 [Desulfosarcina alkanivorans]